MDPSPGNHSQVIENESYNKNSFNFNEDLKEAQDYKEAFSIHNWKENIDFTLIDQNSKTQTKLNDFSKTTLIAQVSTTTNLEQSSVMSQMSEGGVPDTLSEKEIKDSLSLKGGVTESIEYTMIKSSTIDKESSENIDEGNLVFLIRKIDRKTNKSKLLTKHRKTITKCAHKSLEYYAKGMCKNCYHNKGKRSKKATKCAHLNRDHYAKGLCKNCYLHFFHIKKKQRKASALSKAQTSN